MLTSSLSDFRSWKDQQLSIEWMMHWPSIHSFSIFVQRVIEHSWAKSKVYRRTHPQNEQCMAFICHGNDHQDCTTKILQSSMWSCFYRLFLFILGILVGWLVFNWVAMANYEGFTEGRLIPDYGFFFLTPPVDLLDLPFPVHGLLLLSFLRLSNWSSSYHTAHTKIQVLIQKSCSIIHLLYSGDCMKVVCTNGTLKFQKHVPIFCCKCPKIIIPFFTVFFLRLMKYGDGRLIF